MKLGFLASGNLGHSVLQKLLGELSISFVLTDKNSQNIIDLCVREQIPYFCGNPRNGKAIVGLSNVSCELIISVNYLFLIERDIIELASIMAINFHGSLLPKYRGRTPHVWAIINNEYETGITAHKIDLGCDTGDIIAQKRIAIHASDTGGVLLNKFNDDYPGFVRKVINDIEQGAFSLSKQNESLATYFGKRVPDDGRINWNWQKERIYNWVRAQASPYPGAFAFHDRHKIIIHKIRFSDIGYQNIMPNGMILNVDKNVPIVKTSNGCVELVDIETEFELKINYVLK